MGTIIAIITAKSKTVLQLQKENAELREKLEHEKEERKLLEISNEALYNQGHIDGYKAGAEKAVSTLSEILYGEGSTIELKDTFNFNDAAMTDEQVTQHYEEKFETLNVDNAVNDKKSKMFVLETGVRA